MDIDLGHIIELLIMPVVGFFSWIAGTRSRRNTAIQEMMKTINELVEQNSKLNGLVIDLQDKVVMLSNENAELKSNQELMIGKLDKYERENRELRELLTKNNTK